MFKQFIYLISAISFRRFISAICFVDLFQRFNFRDFISSIPRFVSAILFRRFISDEQLGIFIFSDPYIYQVTDGRIRRTDSESQRPMTTFTKFRVSWQCVTVRTVILFVGPFMVCTSNGSNETPTFMPK